MRTANSPNTGTRNKTPRVVSIRSPTLITMVHSTSDSSVKAERGARVLLIVGIQTVKQYSSEHQACHRSEILGFDLDHVAPLAQCITENVMFTFYRSKEQMQSNYTLNLIMLNIWYGRDQKKGKCEVALSQENRTWVISKA